MLETLAQKRSDPPRLTIKHMIQRIAFASVPHLPRMLQYDWLAERITSETGEPVSAGTVKRWWNADHYDNASVDSRHMDWARSRSRQYGVANDNVRNGASGSRDCHPGSSEAVRLAA